MHKHLLTALLVTIVIGTAATSCEKEASTQETPQQMKAILENLNHEGDYVIRERDSKHPFTDYDEMLSSNLQTKSDPENDSYLGFSTKIEEYPFETPRNLGYPVLDLEKYRKDHPGYFTNAPVNTGIQTAIAFDGYERYEEKTQETKTVNSGFNLNLGIFKIKAKHTYKKVFQESETSVNQCVYGEYTNKFFDREYKIQIPEDSWDDLYQNYVHSDFLHSLYNYSPATLIKNYGGFVITNYVTGAQAKLLYRGEHNEHSSSTSTQKEKNFEASISASVKKVEGGVEGGFMVGDGHSSTFDGKYTNVQVSATTIGGTPIFVGFTSPKDIQSISYDFTPWCNSLNDKSKLNIVEFPDNSLIPLTAFIEEDNIKEVFYDYYKTGTTPSEKIQEPYLYLGIKENTYHSKEYNINLKLFTRYKGESITIADAFVPFSYLSGYIKKIERQYPYLKIQSNFNLEALVSLKTSAVGHFVIESIGSSVITVAYNKKTKEPETLIRIADVDPGYQNDYILLEAERLKSLYPKIPVDYSDSGYAGPFGLSMDIINPTIYYDAYPQSTTNNNIDEYISVKYDTDFSTAKKHIDPTSGKIYILTTKKNGNKKIAYTIYCDNIIDDYCMREYLDKIPTVNNISVGYIRRNYRLIAL